MIAVEGVSRAEGRAPGDNRRFDIQGLRAVAVLLVVAYHGGFPVPGGFVGVDVFFVISGFVITGMIDREHRATGRFKFGRFYLRRFKRLTPALSLMVGVTMVLAFCLLSPFVIQQVTAQTGMGAMLLVANFAIAQNTGGYFDAAAELNPLLHTWSLSVEEQFYLVFPAILLLGWVLTQRGHRRVPWTIVLVSAAALISFSLAMAGPDALGSSSAKFLVGFYGPVSRAWEFGAGALLAYSTTRFALGSDRRAQYLAWLGAALLVASAWFINGHTPFPGPWTTLPVVGTLFVIAAGTHQTPVVTRVLALPAVVKIGDWSYSIYLWHWPFRVFADHLWPEVPYAVPLATTLSIVPAVASYRWLEQPFRRLPPQSRSRTTALIAAVLCPSLLLAAGLHVGANDYWKPRYKSGAVPVIHPGDIEWTDFYTYLRDTYYPCSDQALRDIAYNWEGITRCRQSKPGTHIDVAAVGDSHAEQLFLGLAEALPDKNVVYYIRELPVRSIRGMDLIIDHVAADPGIKTVIVTAEWSFRGVPDQLAKTFETFTSKGKSVFVTDDVPTFPFDAVACKYRLSPVLPFSKCSEDLKLFRSAHDRYGPLLKKAADEVPGVQLLNTAQYFCDDSVCSMNKGQALLYRDTNHVNNIGSRYLVDRMLVDYPQLSTALGRR
ncbi:acyltransferase family protein [Mycobacterium kubicae]|uniref:Acyltransferase n=1 Tax=Mycobacterium kubicae TaxID=120959 RepID=A0AAX1JI12_9MYCO|nr:acyltransferase family protein [Mycobacterium kubicae]MCV7095508.1 acyltransferase [Mycobacterium kubicae]ORV94155.1 hypothetical protein AWC13_23230 [Mycobacterium kubicae]QPI39998.1 acyltransferase [Mycobacterium kubicae]